MTTLILLLTAFLMSTANANDDLSVLKSFCEKNQADHWIKTSAACKLARGELELAKLCSDFSTTKNARTKLRIQSIFDKVAELKSIDSETAAAELCPNQLGSDAIASNSECKAEASGKRTVQRNWWDGEKQTQTTQTFSEVKTKADAGDQLAQFNLGSWLSSGAPCVPKDKKTGIPYLCKAYDSGYSFAGMKLKSMTDLPSERLARESLGKQYGCALTARQEEYAAETRKLEGKAKELIKKAESGDVNAMVKVAAIYQATDDGLPQDYKKAFYWAEKAAKKGNAEGMGLLAGLYSRGDGVEQDHEKAFQWSLKAAQKGDLSSMYFVGLNYYDGQGTDQNLQKAVQWLSRAMDRGHEGAREKLLEMLMTGELQATAFKALSDRLKKLESKK